jgi:hypothetical protein
MRRKAGQKADGKSAERLIKGVFGRIRSVFFMRLGRIAILY